MSMAMELIAAVSAAERRIDEQITKLHSYQAQIDNVSQRADAIFSGSSIQCGQTMIEQLAATKRQVADTISMLQTAKQKLIQVRMI